MAVILTDYTLSTRRPVITGGSIKDSDLTIFPNPCCFCSLRRPVKQVVL